MDLSMILSPDFEEEQHARQAPPRQEREPNRKWSADELQCAVAILQDFQQPSPVSSQVDARGRGDTKPAPYYTSQGESKHEEIDALKSSHSDVSSRKG
ncbi:hypothetical protein PHPALM_11574, partial [Phytophthora palmivora]